MRVTVEVERPEVAASRHHGKRRQGAGESCHRIRIVPAAHAHRGRAEPHRDVEAGRFLRQRAVLPRGGPRRLSIILRPQAIEQARWCGRIGLAQRRGKVGLVEQPQPAARRLLQDDGIDKSDALHAGVLDLRGAGRSRGAAGQRGERK
jgi:hypothetical protein